jgi:hypothetical protein
MLCERTAQGTTMSEFFAQDEQLAMLPARTQLTAFGFAGNGGSGGDGGSADGGKAVAIGGADQSGLINVNVLSGNAYADASGGHGGSGGDGGNGHYSSSYEHKNYSWGDHNHSWKH